MTKQERKAASIAKALVKALTRLEQYPGDPADILRDMEIFAATSRTNGVKAAASALCEYYLGRNDERME